MKQPIECKGVLTRACLAIGEDAGVVPVSTGPDQRRYMLPHILLQW